MARNFNGTSDLVATGLQVNKFLDDGGGGGTSETSFAVSAWAWLIAGGGSFPCIFNTSAGALVIFGIHPHLGTGLNLYLNGLENNNSSAFSTGAWHHCVCRYVSNGLTTGTITVYQDGVDVTGSQSGAIGTVSGDTNKLNIADGTNGGNSFWKGYIADLAVWTAANQVSPLSNSEMVALSNGARPYTVRPKNMVGYWPLDGLASPEPDLSGNAFNGTLTGTSLAPIGPPTMMFTPRTPQFIPAAAGGGSAIKFRKTLSQIGGRVGTRQPIGWGI